ncbi:hypothetical protein DFH09DRAFT_1146474 [Mycena vulgaris]|nr:hypothetical protein DFH09DRAFT_1146474 [Mycena vulgaris]
MQLKANFLLLALTLVTVSVSGQGIGCSQLGGTCGGIAGIACCGNGHCSGVPPNVADASGICASPKDSRSCVKDLCQPDQKGGQGDCKCTGTKCKASVQVIGDPLVYKCCVATNGNCNNKVDCCDKSQVCRMDRGYTVKRCLPPV